MENRNKYSDHLEDVQELYKDLNMDSFIYVDIFFFSLFLGIFLFKQIHHYLLPFVISISFYFFFFILYKLFFKEKMKKS